MAYGDTFQAGAIFLVGIVLKIFKEVQKAVIICTADVYCAVIEVEFEWIILSWCSFANGKSAAIKVDGLIKQRSQIEVYRPDYIITLSFDVRWVKSRGSNSAARKAKGRFALLQFSIKRPIIGGTKPEEDGFYESSYL